MLQPRMNRSGIHFPIILTESYLFYNQCCCMVFCNWCPGARSSCCARVWNIRLPIENVFRKTTEFVGFVLSFLSTSFYFPIDFLATSLGFLICFLSMSLSFLHALLTSDLCPPFFHLLHHLHHTPHHGLYWKRRLCAGVLRKKGRCQSGWR